MPNVKEKANELYDKLTQKGISVLYDDREARAGEKFADSDLIGIPKRIIISEKTLESDCVEVKARKTGKIEMIKYERI